MVRRLASKDVPWGMREILSFKNLPSSKVFCMIAATTFQGANATGGKYPASNSLELGYYEMIKANTDIASLSTFVMSVSRARKTTVVDLKFGHSSGEEYVVEGLYLTRVRGYPGSPRDGHIKYAGREDQCLVPYGTLTEHVGSCTFQKVSERFPELKRLRLNSFFICPDHGRKSVTIILRHSNIGFVEVELRYTDRPRGMVLIRPGCYIQTKSEEDYKLKEMNRMEIRISHISVTEQTADIIFHHKEKGQYAIRNVTLRLKGTHGVRDHTYANERCYTLTSNSYRGPMDGFSQVTAAFTQDFPGLTEDSALICAGIDDSIFFINGASAKRGVTQLELMHESVNLRLLACAATEDWLDQVYRIIAMFSSITGPVTGFLENGSPERKKWWGPVVGGWKEL
ncbi:hypothetical protein FOZ63_029068 [Perkinsus olseni]|uniref:Uncharacterized protein n=1 Tax=Perkinsus olseni TaxID=32597 RepID=A0A7J6TF48_PEROL|nr:hypothetical protein FOZ63_029068 [Perkinsus olseni]KAF4743036.1 hypothetical protein FOZ62_011493 [Perkinsus olseni]